MNDIITKVKDWITNNKAIAGIGAAVVLFLLFGKKLLKGRTRRRRHYRPVYHAARRRRILSYRPAARRRSYKRGGKAKKPWQVKGSIAARRHMARLRRMR